ncbi:trihelix transcription factor GTL1-like [Nymphaea colorata]|nr:trihelix transcription factor GTL1-like [Nymphaea colorata]XP_031492558.1 trihelix transcription factor GTL1-like [Nymphaea colorata]
MQSGLEYTSLPDHIQQIISSRSGLHHLSPQPFFNLNPVIDTEEHHHHHQIENSSGHELHLLHHFHQHGLVQDPIGGHHEKPAAVSGMEEEQGEEGEGEDQEERCAAASEIGGEKPLHEHTNRWPREETLALLKIRSSVEATIRDSNFKGTVWEHVSRKLAELGFNRSAKKCKEKFENVTKYYKKTKNTGRQDGKSYRFYSELETLFNNNGSSNNSKLGASASEEQTLALEKNHVDGTSEEETLENPLLQDGSAGENTSKKRRKGQNFEAMKGLCEDMVKKMMAQQEALQRRFLEAVERRDQERMEREEAWKRQEMARLNKETEMRTQEQALASSREATIISFLKRLTQDNIHLEGSLPSFEEAHSGPTPNLNPLFDPEPDPAPISTPGDVSLDLQGLDANGRSGAGPLKRWPSSEVCALIKLRCKHEEKFRDGNSKGSLWERISQEMMQMGYMRSAKRCKEKWENINKYFRKTNGAAKLRPPDSKTCPYFHQLSSLYQNGVLSFPKQEEQPHSSKVLEKCSEKGVAAESGSAEATESSDYVGGMMHMDGGDNLDGMEAQSSLMEMVCKLSSNYDGAV